MLASVPSTEIQINTPRGSRGGKRSCGRAPYLCLGTQYIDKVGVNVTAHGPHVVNTTVGSTILAINTYHRPPPIPGTFFEFARRYCLLSKL